MTVRNEMMQHPIVDQAVLTYLREHQQPVPGQLGLIEQKANEKRVPIIPHETVAFLRVLLNQIRPKQVLEVGTAIGFSASLMTQYLAEDGHLTTIDRFDVMIQAANANFKALGIQDKVTLLQGDASAILPVLSPSFDVIFLDSAKAKYIEMLPDCLRLLKKGGILLVDDVLQGGTVLWPTSKIKHRNHGIHRRLNQLLDYVFSEDQLLCSLLPLGDGLLMVTKQTQGPFEVPAPQ